MQWYNSPRRWMAGGLAILVIVLLRTIFSGPYVFLLDTVTGPNRGVWPSLFYGFNTPSYGGNLPLFMILDAIETVVGAAVAQKLLFFLVLYLCGICGMLLFEDWRRSLFAGVFLLFNPFVYVRFVVGQWLLVWGLAMLALVLKTYKDYFTNRNLSGVRVVLALTLAGFSSHTFALAVLLCSIITIFRFVETRHFNVWRRATVVAVFATVLNSYWLLPTLVDSSKTTFITSADIVAFAPEANGSILYSIASMHGFWRGGITYATDATPAIQFAFVVIFFLAVHGFMKFYRDEHHGYIVKALATSAAIAVVLGSGVSGPAEPVFRWLFETVPFFSGFRDSQKFVALLVIAYAYLAALGATELVSSIRNHSITTRLEWMPLALLLLFVLIPVVYTFPMVAGFAGQLDSGDYPDGWYEANSQIESHGNGGSILFLPWHQYSDYSWISGETKRSANPSQAFFSGPVIRGQNAEVGTIYSQSVNPISTYVRSLFALGPTNEQHNLSNMGELLTHINVEYVALTKDTDWKSYNRTLRNQTDLEPTVNNDDIILYSNEYQTNETYTVDGVRHVDSLSMFFKRSRHEDTTKRIYTFSDNLPSAAGEFRESVQTKWQSPALADLGQGSQNWTVVTQRQRFTSTTWHYNGRGPRGYHLGVAPVYRTNESGAKLRHARFYNLYLPSYLISVISLIGLIGYSRMFEEN